MFVLSSFNSLLNEARYVLALYLGLPLLIGLVVAGVSRLRQGPAVASALLVILLFANSRSALADLPLSQPPDLREETLLTNALLNEGVSYVHTSYWLGMGIMVESGGKIVTSSLLGPTRISYDSRNEERVLAASPESVAFVVRQGAVIEAPFEAYLSEHGASCSRATVHVFTIYHRCAPLPDIQVLRELLPEGPG